MRSSRDFSLFNGSCAFRIDLFRLRSVGEKMERAGWRGADRGPTLEAGLALRRTAPLAILVLGIARSRDVKPSPYPRRKERRVTIRDGGVLPFRANHSE
jgi:hypothetical protein